MAMPIALLDPRRGRPPARARRSAPLLPLVLLGVVSGCASAPPPAEPVVDPGQVQREALQASALDHPYRVVFSWELREPGVRLQGRGVARIEPPYRARLDLFSGTGDRLGAAALVDDDLRIPTGMAVTLPPAAMLWGALGVFRPGPGVWGASATRPSSSRATLRYLSAEGGELQVFFLDRRIERVVRSEDGRAREELRVRFGGAERFPRDATYRDHAAVRELTLTMESVEHVETFPPEIWNPGGDDA